LRDFAEMLIDISRDRPGGDSSDIAVLAPSVLSTVGLRRATEARSVTITNLTGLDIHVVPCTAAFASGSGFVPRGSVTRLDCAAVGVDEDGITLSLRIAASAVEIVGEREPVFSLPVTSSSNQARLLRLKPSTSLSTLHPGRAELLRLFDGRASPESMLSEGLVLDSAYYDAEPVVEWCMQNQRLRSSIVDVFSIQKGVDLVSSNVWSPEDDLGDEEAKVIYEHCGQEAPVETDGPEAAAGAMQRRPVSPERAVATGTGHVPNKSNWLRPYLKNDSPEWSDMTCMLSMARERVMLPDSKWIWVNDWTVDVNGRLGEETDADGWSYETDFETFSKVKRHYKRGDGCRRRRWTRTRMVKPPSFEDPFRQLKFVWETSKDENGCFSVTVRSHVRIRNATSSTLTFFVYTPSWDEDKLVGTTKAGEEVYVPVSCASAVYMRIAKNAGVQELASLVDCVFSDRFSIVPTSHTSSSYIRTSMNLEDVSGTTLHFLVELRSVKGILDIIVEPVFRLVNLLPCQLECQVGQVFRPIDARPGNAFSPRQSGTKRVTKTEALTIQSGKEGACTAVNPWRKPHLSLRIPGYRWSSWKRIVNRKTDSTWRPSEIEEEWHFTSIGDNEYAEELKTLVRFERLGKLGDPLVLILSVACGHCPTIRVYSQYWIVDKTGFGCRFSEGFTDLLGTVPDPETSRRSYLLKEEAKDAEIRGDMSIPGHQWSIGSSGMSLYFSQREKLALAIETGIDRSSSKRSKNTKSKWISPLDISNVIPKTVFAVDELNGPRRFELALHVTLCPGLFARTKMISLLPRYQIVNLLHRELAIAQDGCLDSEIIIPSQSSIAFHWEKGSMPPKVRLGAPSADERARGNYERCWTHGRFQLDRIGITSLRLPTTNTLVKVPMVVQAEVRLATKDQPSAVVVVVWSGNDKSNPLYTLRNRTRHTILCRQPLQDEDNELTGSDGDMTNLETCTGIEGGSYGFECGADFGPMLRSFLGLERIEEFVWILKPQDVTCFGFDDPEKPHILEWTYVNNRKSHFDKRLKKAVLEVDAMGSFSVLTLPGGPQVRCQLRAEHSTKVIEFVEIGVSGRPTEPLVGTKALDALRQQGLHFQEMLESEVRVHGDKEDSTDDDETVTFSLRMDLPALSISVVDNVDPKVIGREILLAQFERLFLAFSQTREGYHEFEARLMSFQCDNHIQKSIHPVLVSTFVLPNVSSIVPAPVLTAHQIFCPRVDEGEPLLHMSAVRRLQLNSSTFVFLYAAIRLLEVEIYLDRRSVARQVHHFRLRNRL
jgi:SHR-binding domain of vacuolar-sorting associated protein 13